MHKPPKHKNSLHKKYQSTLFIFPVLLPLAELIPWLLTLIGMTAGGLQFFKKSIWSRRSVRIVTICIAITCLAGAVFLLAQRVHYAPSLDEGSTLVAKDDLSIVQIFSQVPNTSPHGPPKTFSLLWTATTPHQNIGKPAIAGSMLLVGTYQGTLDAFALANGSHLWSLVKREQIFPAPVAEGNTAYVGEGHHTSPASVLTAFFLPNGAVLWERKFRSHIESSVVTDTANQRVYLSAGETGLWALHSKSGKSLWHSPIGHSDITPVLLNKVVFTAAQLKENTNGSAFFMLNAATGATLLSQSLPGNPMGSMLTDGQNNLYVATAIGQVGVTRATDAGWVHSFSQQGKLLWSVTLPAMPLPEGVYSKEANVVVYTLSNGSIIALNAHDGSTVWQAKIGDAFQTDATLIPSSRPLLAAVSMEGIVTIRDVKSGEEKRRFTVEKGASYPLYHEEILYISTPYNIRAYSGVRE